MVHRTRFHKTTGQENFSGTPIGPQSTPVIVKNRLITLSFTGQLTCLDRTDGSNVWRKDLVADLGASPVQFGFSASPIVDHSSPDRVYVMGAGKSGGFYCLRVADGSTIWKAACDSFSYATPTDANFGNVEQWIVVSENESLGIAKSDGSRLWRFPMPSPGLTNVPTPLVVNESRLLISGQGCKGTRCLEINNQNGKWSVSQKWFLPQIEYFYGNWLRWSDDIVIGCTEAYLAAIDVAQGTVLGRYRGYGKGNVSRTRDQLIVVNGEGKLSLLTPNTVQSETSGFDVVGEFNLIQARCWTPLSYVDGRLFLRGDGRIICMEKTRENDQLAIPNQLTESKPLTFISQPADRSTADPVEEIFAMFQRQGQGAALRLYSKLRSANALSESARIELAEAAFDQGLPEVAKMILSHAAADFPNSRDIKQATKRLSGK
jgi:outer membrane protein assembly factor BamB